MVTQSDWLAAQVDARRVMPFKFADQLFLVDSRSAVYWIAQDMLLVSDLHLEKGSYLGQFANPIPHYDSRKTLSSLTEIIADYQPKTVVSLGDSFHDGKGFERMQSDERKSLHALVESVETWVWILGNHDPSLPIAVGGQQKVNWTVSNILLTHEPEQTTNAQIMGHFHPKATVKQGRLKVRGRSLLASKERLIMPAFGQYTGGLDFNDPAFDAVLGKHKLSGFVLSENRVFPLGAVYLSYYAT